MLAGNKMHGRSAILLALVLLVSASHSSRGASLRLVVQPTGTNQVEVTLTPVITNQVYTILVRSNGPSGHWLRFATLFSLTNARITTTCGLGNVAGLNIGTLKNWRFAAGRWQGAGNDEFPGIYEELALRMDPRTSADPYANPMGDGWNNIRKFQGDMDPLAFYPPPPPRPSASFRISETNAFSGAATVSWAPPDGPLPDYFIVERAIRKPRFRTNELATRPLPLRPNLPGASTNRLARPIPSEREPRSNNVTNGTANRVPRPPANSPPDANRGRPPRITLDGVETGPYVEIARVPSRVGLAQYRFVDQNVDARFEPLYRLRAHHTPPLRAYLERVDSRGISNTLISASATPSTNGYSVVVPRPMPYARYLLLVRDKNDPQWKASGYFASGTNRDPVRLQVDRKGMMSEGQWPIAMPKVKHLQEVLEPEFVAGWGDDSDGDGLPDIYEVLATRTRPDNADTGETGVLDGFKEMTEDGWSNLEKFRRRLDPLRPAKPPSTVELSSPTEAEIFQALRPKSDLYCEVAIGIRTNDSGTFQPLEYVPDVLGKILNLRRAEERKDFDIRVSWQFAKPESIDIREDDSEFTEFLKTVEPLRQKIRLQILTALKAQMATNPPLPWPEAQERIAALVRARRSGDVDELLVMEQAQLFSDNIQQDFHGKAVDQHGQPVVDAAVTANTVRNTGASESAVARTDNRGFFQFSGLRGRAIDISASKQGFEIKGHGAGRRNSEGPETSSTNRGVLTMWKLKGAEPLIHNVQTFQFKADNRVYTLDLLANTLIEGTNEMGDFWLQCVRPAVIKRGEHFDWSFTFAASGGGFREPKQDDYLNEAPATGYQPTFSLGVPAADPKWRGYQEQRFYLKSRNGKVYGHIRAKVFAVSGDGAAMEIESYMNPGASRNLEFDPAKTATYTPKTPSAAPLTPAVPTRAVSRTLLTNQPGHLVSWGAIVMPFVEPGTRFTAVAAGSEHSLALKSDGTVIAWGRNRSGEATVPEGLSNVVAIAAGGRSHTGFSVALQKDGRVVAWGTSLHFQTAVPPGLSNVVAIAAGTEHCVALKRDGTVVEWGSSLTDHSSLIFNLSNIVAVAAGYESSIALRKDGTVVEWGSDSRRVPAVPIGLSNVVSVGSGFSYNLALLRNGDVVGWSGTSNALASLPVAASNAIGIAAGPWHSSALKRDGTVVAWGSDRFSATAVPKGLSNVVAISSGGSDHGDHTLALRSDGTILGWGNNNFGQSLSPTEMTNIVSVAAGGGHCLALRNDGSIVGWGGQDEQGYGQAWVPEGLGPAWLVGAGSLHSLAGVAEGKVIGWGYGVYGQTAPPSDLTNAIAIAGGYSHSLALRNDGTVVGWGRTGIPSGLSNAVAIAAAGEHSLAMKGDGSVIAWGSFSVPTNVAPNLTNTIAIAAGAEYSNEHDMALRRDGTVVTWDRNTFQTNIPANLTNVIAIAAGGNHNLALRRDRTVVGWEPNGKGELPIPWKLGNVLKIAAGSGISLAIEAPTAGPLLKQGSVSRRWTRLLAFAGLCATIAILASVCRRPKSR